MNSPLEKYFCFAKIFFLYESAKHLGNEFQLFKSYYEVCPKAV